MDPFSYDPIQRNNSAVTVQAAAVQVTWKCPASGRDLGESATTERSDSRRDSILALTSPSAFDVGC